MSPSARRRSRATCARRAHSASIWPPAARTGGLVPSHPRRTTTAPKSHIYTRRHSIATTRRAHTHVRCRADELDTKCDETHESGRPRPCRDDTGGDEAWLDAPRRAAELLRAFRRERGITRLDRGEHDHERAEEQADPCLARSAPRLGVSQKLLRTHRRLTSIHESGKNAVTRVNKQTTHRRHSLLPVGERLHWTTWRSFRWRFSESRETGERASTTLSTF